MMMGSRHGNRVNAISAPRGAPSSAAKRVALRLTARDNRTIAKRAESPLRMRSQADVPSITGKDRALRYGRLQRGGCTSAICPNLEQLCKSVESAQVYPKRFPSGELQMRRIGFRAAYKLSAI